VLNIFWPSAFIISFVLKRSLVIVIFIENQLAYVKYKKINKADLWEKNKWVSKTRKEGVFFWRVTVQ